MDRMQKICSMITSLIRLYALRLLSMGIRQRHCVLWISNNLW